MRLSLRKKYLIMITPAVLILLFLLAGDILPSLLKVMTTDLGEVKAHMDSAVLAEQFAGHLNQQLEEYLHVILFSDPGHRQQLADVRDRVGDVLLALKGQSALKSRSQQSRALLEKIIAEYREVDSLGGKILTLAAEGETEAARYLLNSELKPRSRTVLLPMLERFVLLQQEEGRKRIAETYSFTLGSLGLLEFFLGAKVENAFENARMDFHSAVLAERYFRFASRTFKEVSDFAVTGSGVDLMQLEIYKSKTGEVLDLITEMTHSDVQIHRSLAEGLSAAHERIMLLDLEVKALADAGRVREAVALIDEIKEQLLNTDVRRLVDEYVAYEKESRDRELTLLIGIMQGTTFLVILLVTGAIAVAWHSFWLLGNQVVAPIESLKEAADLFGAGELQARATETWRTDEIGQLIISFNAMAASLQKALQELKEKNSELERLLYTVTHDLRSPLVNVQGFSREINELFEELQITLEKGAFSLENRDKLDLILSTDIPEALYYISASAARMDMLLTGLLRYSRAGRVERDLADLDMDKLIGEVGDVLQSNIREKEEQVYLQVNIDQLPPCRGDQLQIRQLFTNLLDNALRCLHPGRPGVISISGCVRENEVVYVVEDNGIGIAPEHHEKIFKLFHRLNNGDTSGEGLGLTIARKIAERHGGRIWVESIPGVGSKFFVALPAIK